MCRLPWKNSLSRHQLTDRPLPLLLTVARHTWYARLPRTLDPSPSVQARHSCELLLAQNLIQQHRQPDKGQYYMSSAAFTPRSVGPAVQSRPRTVSPVATEKRLLWPLGLTHSVSGEECKLSEHEYRD